jgi:hypothetical protein
VGVSEQEGAHMRLLLRKSEQELNCAWRWGEEESADLVIVDVRSFAGQMARTRAHGAGVRYAIFSDKKVEDADLVLQRPLQRANMIAVLNQAAETLARDPTIGANTADFYTRDIGDSHAAIVPEMETRFLQPVAIAGLDELLRPEPVELRAAEPWAPPAAPMAVASPAPAEEFVEAPVRVPAPAVPMRAYASRESMLADTAPRELREYLDDNLLLMPARFTLPGAVPLTLDPKNRVAHAPGPLAGLAPYCRGRWRLCDWQPLTNAELSDIRETQQAHSYSRLIWLQVLLLSGGHLASHLDPGGTYRLKHWVEIEKELSRYFRIASAMLQPARLHEIAAAASAPMSDVFDLINAYDAIGLIEWQPRPRRNDEADKKAPRLLGRLRNPFGKT